MHRILLVDDEKNELNALCRELEDSYDVESFSDPVDALIRGREQNFDLVISDYKMPEINGIQFLKKFGRLQPDASRMILSGETDTLMLMDAINETHVYRFLNKPWDSLELASAVAQALSYRDALLERNRLLEQLKQGSGGWLDTAASRRYNILVVDDDQRTLNAVVRDLTTRSVFMDWHMKQQRDDEIHQQDAANDVRFDVFTSNSPYEVLNNPRLGRVDVVIADYFMREMDGIHFLESFRQQQPDAMRVMLSGRADRLSLVDAINRLEIFAFVGKPWREYELKSALHKAIAYKDLLRENVRMRKMAV